MIIQWIFALALVLVAVSHAQIDGVDAATQLQHERQPMQMTVDDGGGELEPDLFCEPLGDSSPQWHFPPLADLSAGPVL